MRVASLAAMPCFLAKVAAWYGSRAENPRSAWPRRGVMFDTNSPRPAIGQESFRFSFLLLGGLAVPDLRTNCGRGAFAIALVLFGLPGFFIASYLTLGHLSLLLLKTELAIIGRSIAR